MTDRLSIKGVVRTELGTPASGRIRKDNMIPAVIYGGGGKNEFISLPKKEMDKLYLTGHLFTTILDIDVNGKIISVLPYMTDIHPVMNTPRHLDLVRIQDGKPIKAKILLEFTDKEKSPGIKKGGYLNILYRRLELMCDPNNIPHIISINVGKIGIGDKIKISSLQLPAGIMPTTKKDLIIASMIGRGKEEEEEKKVESVAAVASTTPGATGTTSSATAPSGEKSDKKAEKPAGKADKK